MEEMLGRLGAGESVRHEEVVTLMGKYGEAVEAISLRFNDVFRPAASHPQDRFVVYI